MPPKKKQSGRNGFYHFMIEFKDKHGRSFKSMNEVAQAAGPHWQNMSKEQRRPYEERALMERNNVRAVKYTSDGISVEGLEREEREEQKKIVEMKEEINHELKTASRSGRIGNKDFFIIHINCFCYRPPENRYYPAEIGIANFTLETGVLPENVFHRMIKPGPLPLGFAGDATLHSKETHQIPPPPLVNDGENNMQKVYSEMKEFLQSKMEGSRRMPILYCDERDMKIINSVLDAWNVDYDGGRTLFKVYNLQYVFRILRNMVAGDNVWPSDSISAREIEKDVNAYASGIACDYHETTNVALYCSRSVAVRYAFTICDNCCKDLDIVLIPGRHVPNTARSFSYSRPSSVASGVSQSSRSRRVDSSVREDDRDTVISFSSRSEWENQSITSETSSSHAIHDDEDFPSLGTSRRQEMSWNNFNPSDSSSVFSQSSVKSYAGATGTSGLSRRPADVPSSITNNMEKLSLDSSRASDTISVDRGISNSFGNADHFPALRPQTGRVRGAVASRGRGVRRPNNDQ